MVDHVMNYGFALLFSVATGLMAAIVMAIIAISGAALQSPTFMALSGNDVGFLGLGTFSVTALIAFPIYYINLWIIDTKEEKIKQTVEAEKTKETN